MIKKYVKLPVEIEAIQLTDNDYSILQVLRFIGKPLEINHNNKVEADAAQSYLDSIKDEGIFIETLEGTMRASIGDYVIKGITGEFYPCKPEIFKNTYKEA